MSVAYASADALPYVCAVYVCGCGRRAVRHGPAAGAPPRGWRASRGGETAAHACPECVAAGRAPAGG